MLTVLITSKLCFKQSLVQTDYLINKETFILQTNHSACDSTILPGYGNDFFYFWTLCFTILTVACFSGHINNLYNTCFWKLIQEKGLTPAESQERLKVSWYCVQTVMSLCHQYVRSLQFTYTYTRMSWHASESPNCHDNLPSNQPTNVSWQPSKLLDCH